MLRVVYWLVAVALALVAAYWTLLFVSQRSMLFPAPSRDSRALPAGVKAVSLQTSAGPGYALFLRGDTAAPKAPALIFTHGNGELASHWIDAFDPLLAAGVHVVLAEYPGYGEAPGSPSESAIAAHMTATYHWAASQPAIDSARIVVYGRSLGGAAAVRIASENPVAAMILESTFTSTAAFAGDFYAPAFLIRDKLDALSGLKSYRGPLLVIHGAQDTLVPISHGRQLAATVPGSEFLELQCGHNDCPRQWNRILQFLSARGILTAS